MDDPAREVRHVIFLNRYYDVLRWTRKLHIKYLFCKHHYSGAIQHVFNTRQVRRSKAQNYDRAMRE